MKGGYFRESPVRDQFYRVGAFFLVLNYFSQQHNENIPVTSRKPQFTQKHLSPCQIHNHNKEMVTKLYLLDKTAKRNKK